jgi:hypothetical protein
MVRSMTWLQPVIGQSEVHDDCVELVKLVRSFN